jgi:RNA polymerase sigma-70 factor (ECF subfamily)
LRPGELKNPHSLASFVRQTAINVSIGHFRKEKRYVHGDDRKISLLVVHEDHKANRIDRDEMRVALPPPLGQLSVQRDREILCRFYFFDEGKERIREDLNLSSAHFDRVLHRARKRMQSIVSRQEGLKIRLCGELYEA